MTFETPRHADDVFAYMARFSNAAEWDPGVISAEDLSGGEPALGSTYRLVVAFGGRSLPLDYRICEFDPPQRVVLVAENAYISSRDSIELAATANGTMLTYRAVLSAKGLFRLATPLLALGFKKTGDRAAKGLQSTLAG
jgi:hypothetical protein